MTVSRGDRYCILLNDVLVPLVIVPYQLTHCQLKEEGWKLVKEDQELPSSPTLLAPVDIQTNQPVSLSKTTYIPPDHHTRRIKVTARDLSQLLQEIPPSHTERTVQHPKGTFTSERSAFVSDSITSAYAEDAQCLTFRAPHIPTPFGVNPDPSKKEYCTHWLRRGECDYTQQGCRYKHEMPDLKKLREIGFREIPRWYSEKTRISPRGSSWRRQVMDQDNNDPQLSTEPPASRAFRPPTLTDRRGEPYSDRMESPAPQIIRAAVEIGDLIDLGDSPPTTPLWKPATPVNSLLSAAPLNAGFDIALRSNKLLPTLASTLRQEIRKNDDGKPESEETQPVTLLSPIPDGTMYIDTPPNFATPISTSEPSPQALSSLNSFVDLSLEPPPPAMATEVKIGQEIRKTSDRVLEVKSEVRQDNDPSAVSSKNAKPSKPTEAYRTSRCP
jgi:hypothetical protein